MVQNTLIRDQIIVGACNEAIREDALKIQWDLANLTQNGCTIEFSAVALTEIKPDLKFDVNKAGKYSKRSKDSKRNTKAKFTCWKCEKESCSSYDKCEYSNKCPKCKKYGHAPNSRICKGGREGRKEKHCRRGNKCKNANRTEATSSSQESSPSDANSSDTEYTSSTTSLSNSHTEPVHSVIKNKKKRHPKILTLDMKAKRRGGCRKKHIKTHAFSTRKVKGDFRTSILINNTEIEVLVDTGADVNVIAWTCIIYGVTLEKM